MPRSAQKRRLRKEKQHRRCEKRDHLAVPCDQNQKAAGPEENQSNPIRCNMGQVMADVPCQVLPKRPRCPVEIHISAIHLDTLEKVTVLGEQCGISDEAT